VRAGRLVTLLLLLRARGRMTAGQLAAELEVSERTVLRDIEALSGAGVPVYALRGSRGGFELLGEVGDDLPVPIDPIRPRDRGRALRATVRLSPHGRRLAALRGQPQGLRIRAAAGRPPGRPDWVEGTVRIDSLSAALHDLLALGPEVEVLHPAELRAAVAAAASATAALHQAGPGAG